VSFLGNAMAKSNDKPSATLKGFAKHLQNFFDVKISVKRHWDEPERSHIDVFYANDVPEKGLTTYVTLGLQETPVLKKKVKGGIRTEVMGICRTNVKDFPNAVSTAAFCVINSKWELFPGKIYPDVIGMYKMSRTMRHVLFVPPIPWDRELGKVNIRQREIHLLSMIPISEAEYVYAEENGADALEDLLDANHIDYMDINRPSCV